MSQQAIRMPEARARPVAAPAVLPVIVVGNGPVGMRLVRELLARAPQLPVILYGSEEHLPHNRVRLSSWLAGDVPHDGLWSPLAIPPGAQVQQRFGCAVLEIEPDAHCISDSQGRRERYARLVLATGSLPHVPAIPGIELPGVFTLRDMNDATRLMARRASSRQTVVLGGGLLGLEAARAMQRLNTRVSVVEHADRLMARQLDEAGAEALRLRIAALGIECVVGEGARKVLGEERVRGVELRSGAAIACETLVVATGIRPAIALAREARLAHNRGVRVDDQMRTSAPDVYAIGECAEHRGEVPGTVAPGLEQAAVAAAHIAGADARLPASVAAAQLKVAGCAVFSMGPVGAEQAPSMAKDHVYRDAADNYRKVLIARNRLIGAIAIGEWAQGRRVQSAIARAQWVWPWQTWRLRRHGDLWPDEEATDVAAWPADAVVCHCMGVSRGSIGTAVSRGACSVAAIAHATGASTVCGSCEPLVQELAGASTPAEPVPFHRALWAIALVSSALALIVALSPPIPYPDSVQVPWRWDVLWRDALAKQISGFTMLGLLALGLVLSPRKRIAALRSAGRYDLWRLLHLGLGLLAIVALILHTGMRLGSGLNLALMGAFLALLLLGGVSTGVIATEHRLGAALARRLRRRSLPMDSHPRSKFTDPRNADRLQAIDALACTTCHTEHRPRITLANGLTQPPDLCFHCHAKIGEERPSHQGMAFTTCTDSGCHNFHDNRALYTDFLIKHLDDLDTRPGARVPERQFAAVVGEVIGYPHERFPLQPLAANAIDAPQPDAVPDTLRRDWLETAHSKAGVNCSGCHQPLDEAGTPQSWTDHPGLAGCSGCHDVEAKAFQQGKHGMRLEAGLSPMTPAQARLPMHEAAANQELACTSCHGAHRFDVQHAAASACLDCHADAHTKAWQASPHGRLWQAELAGRAEAGSGVSCATCHMPREEQDVSEWMSRIVVEHNQSANFAPNSKMIRPACLHCHGLGFSINALADEAQRAAEAAQQAKDEAKEQAKEK